MIQDASDLVRVVIAMLYSGVFWTVAWLTIVRRPSSRSHRVAAALVMVLAVYLFISIVVPMSSHASMVRR